MEFGLFTEFQCPAGMREAAAFDESMAQMRAAEDLGFDAVWLAEIHFQKDRSVLASNGRGTQRARRAAGRAHLRGRPPGAGGVRHARGGGRPAARAARGARLLEPVGVDEPGRPDPPRARADVDAPLRRARRAAAQLSPEPPELDFSMSSIS